MSPQHKTILLIDDDPDIVKLIQFRLVREGFTLRHAADGEQGLREIESDVLPDLVILDVMMPYHNGFELLARLRGRAAWRTVPVLMLTSLGREADVVRGLEGGANDYLLKPFRPAELVARVRRALA